MVPYFQVGLEHNEFCLWVISAPLTKEDARCALRHAIPNLDHYLAAGSIELLPHDAWYLQGGAVDLYRVIDGWNAKLDQALARGYDGMRVSGSMAWLQKQDWNDFCAYEQELNEAIAHQRMIVLCTYPLAASGATEILDVIRTHQFAIARRNGNWEVVELPALKHAKAEITRRNATLEQRVIERTSELAATNEALRRELTERTLAEAALRASQQQYELQLVIDTIPAMVSSTLPDGSVDSANQRWLEYTGRPLEEGQGWGWTAGIHPEDLARVLDDWRAAVATGEPVEMESRVRRADGEYRWFLHRSVPLRDELGNIVKWYSVSTDIEDRKRAEDALWHSESQLAEAQRLAHIGSWNWDLRSRTVTWSDELYHIFGLQAQEIDIAHAAMEFIHREDRDLVMAAVESSLKTNEPYDFYYRILWPDGGERIAHSRGYVVSDEHGAPIRVFGTTQDVTALKRAEEERERLFHAMHESHERLQTLSNQLLVAQETERRAIARELHDEIGQVLNAVSANLQAIQLSPDAATLAGRLKESVNLVDEALGQIRDLSLDLRPSMLDDFGLVPALAWFVDRQAQRSGFSAAFVAEPSEMRMPANLETTVFRVAQIALTNVARHAQAKRVHVELRQHEAELELLIQDDGIGFDVRAALERASHGVTLGLLSMQERVRLAGGALGIKSVPNQGTEIRARFPGGRKEAP